MKKIWKSYGVFTPTAYKIFGLAVIPCIILGLIELFVYANLFSAGISVILFFVYVVWYEVLVDYWIFGGICEKSTRSMEYLKTSLRGESTLAAGMTGDCIRRGVYMLVPGFLLLVQKGSWRYLLALLIAEFVICLTLVIIRHWNYGVKMQLAIGGVSGIIYAILYGSCSYLMDCAGKRDLILKIMVVIFVIANVIINVFIVKHTVKCLRGSYYEKENK